MALKYGAEWIGAYQATPEMFVPAAGAAWPEYLTVLNLAETAVTPPATGVIEADRLPLTLALNNF